MGEDFIRRYDSLSREIYFLRWRLFLGVLGTPLLFGFWIIKDTFVKINLLKRYRQNVLSEAENFAHNSFFQISKSIDDLFVRGTYLENEELFYWEFKIKKLLDFLHFLNKKRDYFSSEFLKEIKKMLLDLSSFLDVFRDYNKKFLESEKLEHRFLFLKNNFYLEDAQQTAVVTDDKYNLVVAGAGAGKTEVLITRIAYLLKRHKNKIKPNKILAIAFQNKAAKEIRQRLKERYDLDVEIRTFHSLGNKIIEDFYSDRGLSIPRIDEKLSEGAAYQGFIQDIYKKHLADSIFTENTIRYLSSVDLDGEKIESDFESKEKYYHYKRNQKYVTLNDVVVKSEQEKYIFNFFLTHKLNGKDIKIEYERPATWMNYLNERNVIRVPKPDFYFPDFDVYWEHWALSKNGNVPDWFEDGGSYIGGMSLKRKKYQENDKILVETISGDFENGFIDDLLEKKFLEVLLKKYPEKIFTLEAIGYNELVEKVSGDYRKVINKIPKMIARFIALAKTRDLSVLEVERRLQNGWWSNKQSFFASLSTAVYGTYQKYLDDNGLIDFQDMINLAVRLLKDNKNFYQNKYDHILVDEYQDISDSRYNLVKILLDKNSHAKLFCVGDDWQSIMGFAGSDLDLFVNFKKYFPDPTVTFLETNHRSLKTIVDAGRSVIDGNGDYQIFKNTKASRKIINLINILLIDAKNHYSYYEKMVNDCLLRIIQLFEKGVSYDDIMILYRISNRDLLNVLFLEASKLKIPLSIKSEKNKGVRVMTVHKSKGLQAKAVFVLDVVSGLYGFPCGLENPDVMAVVNEKVVHYQEKNREERRLFYVAITRAKDDLFIYTKKGSESLFLKDLEYFSVKHALKENYFSSKNTKYNYF